MKTTKIIAGLGVVAALGVAAVPLSTHAQSTATAEDIVTINVLSTLYMSLVSETSETLNAGATDTANLHSDVIVATGNTAGGYDLTIQAKTGTDVNLTTSGGNMISGSATVLAPAAGSGSPFAGGSYTWGINSTAYSNTGVYGTGAPIWSAASATMPTTAATLIATTNTANASASAANADVYRVLYGVTTASNQPSGSYSATNVYTLTDN